MCIHPIMAWYNKCLNPTGNRGIHFKPSIDDSVRAPFGDLSVPCGKCIGCFDDRRKKWVNRLLLEFDVHGKGTFITLTYRDCPDALEKRPAQLFIKRLRHAARDYGVSLPTSLRYFLCGERGAKRGRPHYHAIIFGVDMFEAAWEPYLVSCSGSGGYPVFSSRVLEQIWPHGFVTIGEATPSSIRYVAKYVCKSSPDDDSFALKSLSLGADKFFIRTRDGRKINYKYRYPDSFQQLISGNVHISNGRCGAVNVRIPKDYIRCVECISHLDAIDVKLMRELDAVEYFNSVDLPQVIASYNDRLRDTIAKDKIKRTLH